MAYETFLVRIDRRRMRPHDPATDSQAFLSLKVGGTGGTEVTNTNVVTTDNTATFLNKTFDAEGTGNSLANITDSNIKAAAGILESKLALDYSTSGLNTAITNHVDIITGNPHQVTQTEVGLSNVTNDAQVPLAGGTMTGFLTLSDNPTNALHAATKSYVDQLAITGGQIKEALLLTEQMSNTQGILAAQVLFAGDLAAEDDTVIVTDGTNTETFTFKTAPSLAFEVAHGATAIDTMTNLAAAINADSVHWSALYTSNGLDSINTDGVIVVYEKLTAAGASTSRIYGVWATAANASVIQYNGEIEYRTGKTPITMPATDPAAGNFGFRRQVVALINGELHLALEADIIMSWDQDSNSWLTLSGSGSLPDATSASGGAIKGKVTADSDKGLSITTGILEVVVDSTHFEFVTGAISIVDFSLGTTQLRLENNSFLVGRNAANSANVDLFKLNASDRVEMASFWLTPASAPAGDYDVANKVYVDDSISAAKLRSYTVSGWTNGDGSQAVKGDIGFLDTDNAVKPAGAGTTSIFKKRILVCFDATITNASAGNWIALPSTPVGDDSGMTTVVTGEEVYLSSTPGVATQDIDSITATHAIILLGYGAASNSWEFIRPEYIGNA